MVNKNEHHGKAVGNLFSKGFGSDPAARPQLREDAQGGGAEPLGITTIFTANSGGGIGKIVIKNQHVRHVVDDETGELVRFEFDHKRREWRKSWDSDESLIERWMLQRYAKKFLSRPEFFEEREKYFSVPYTDLTHKVSFCDIETRKIKKVLSHELGLPVVRMKKHPVAEGVAVSRAPTFRVVSCCSQRLPGKKAELHQNKATGSVNFQNIGVCGSVWTCAVCSAKINRFRRDEISGSYEAIERAGGCAYMLTFTCKHGLSDELADLLPKFKEAFQIFEKSPAFKQVTRKEPLKRPESGSLPFLGYIGRIANLEVTYGANGWHPHEHHLWFFKRELKSSEIAAIRDRLFDAWKAACLSVGLPAPLKFLKAEDGSRRCIALDIRKAMSAAEYLTKFGQFDSDGNRRERRWGPEKELAGAHVKRAGGKGRTPFQLLFDASQGCKSSRERFIEFAQAFKGRHQLQFSRSLKAYLAEFGTVVDESDDEEIAAALDGESELLLELDDEQFERVVRNHAQGLILSIARRSGADAVIEFIARLPESETDDDGPFS